MSCKLVQRFTDRHLSYRSLSCLAVLHRDSHISSAAQGSHGHVMFVPVWTGLCDTLKTLLLLILANLTKM